MNSRGLAIAARPLLLFLVGAALVFQSTGCAGSTPPPVGEEPARAEPSREPPTTLTGYLLVIEPVADESASREVRQRIMEDFRREIQTALARASLFAEVRTEGGGRREPFLLLRPVVLLDRVTRPADPDAMVEMEVRFEMRVSTSRGLVWHAEYREQSPQELLHQSPFRDRQRILANQAIRQRILAALRRDLTRFLVAY